MSLNDVLDTVAVSMLLAFFNRVLEQLLVPIERELIHGIDLVQIVQYEEED